MDADDSGATVEDTAKADTTVVDSGTVATDDTGKPDTEKAPHDTGTVATDGSGCALHGFSGTLASFKFAGQPGDETSVPADMTATGLTVSAITRSSALSPNTGSGSMNAKGWTSTAAYYTFVVTPPAGCSISPDTLSGTLQGSTTGPSSAHAATNANGFTASASSDLASFSTTLSGATSAPVEVRLFGTGASSPTGTLRVTALTLTGSID